MYLTHKPLPVVESCAGKDKWGTQCSLLCCCIQTTEAAFTPEGSTEWSLGSLAQKHSHVSYHRTFQF